MLTFLLNTYKRTTINVNEDYTLTDKRRSPILTPKNYVKCRLCVECLVKNIIYQINAFIGISLRSVTAKNSGIISSATVGNTDTKPSEETRTRAKISERALFVCINRCARAFV